MAAFTLTTKHIAQQIGVTPQRHGRALWTLDSLKDSCWMFARSGVAGWQQLGEACQYVLHANNGRLPNAAALTLREMSAYRAIKVAVAVASADMHGMVDADRARAISAIITEVAR